MAYPHGVYINEDPTPVITPVQSDSAIQVVIGTAPINTALDMVAAVNRPILINSFTEAIKAVGYSDDFNRFSLCQSVGASFRVFNVAPLVLINVLDPGKHTTHVEGMDRAPADKKLTVGELGVILESVEIQGDGVNLVRDTDFSTAFDDKGNLVIFTEEVYQLLTLSYDYLDPAKVTELDIIGGYNAQTGEYTGLELIEQIYPRLGILPGQILAPGWSHLPSVNAVMTAKLTNINGGFKCIGVSDLNTTEAHTYDRAYAWKNDNGYVNENLVVCWPKVKVAEKVYYMSAIWAALTAYVDSKHESVPYKSPSNELMRITGTVIELGSIQQAVLSNYSANTTGAFLEEPDGMSEAYLESQDPFEKYHLETYLDQLQANYLNGLGICTALNLNGWRSWGNNTSVYPNSSDVKDRYIPVRRMFNWWGNTFILTYFQLVDDPANLRLIEAVVDSENIRANGFQSKGMIAFGRIEFNMDENPITDILNGQIHFRQRLAFFTPAEAIINTLIFDPLALQNYLIRGETFG
ncbi:MAG: phage tail sheath family protein [Clostridiales bacterium]|jgi:phage tail sheath protein FI|nr:phage tail sheath family protein [Clostridiales bacterium]